MSCDKCEREMIDGDWQWDESDLLLCGCCRQCGCVCDDWMDKVVRRHATRTGIFRLYCYENTREPGRLKLEFVLRGNVLFKLPLWRIKPMFSDEI